MGYMFCFTRDLDKGYNVLDLLENIHGSFIFTFDFVGDPILVYLHLVLVFDGDPYGLAYDI